MFSVCETVSVVQPPPTCAVTDVLCAKLAPVSTAMRHLCVSVRTGDAASQGATDSAAEETERGPGSAQAREGDGGSADGGVENVGSTSVLNCVLTCVCAGCARLSARCVLACMYMCLAYLLRCAFDQPECRLVSVYETGVPWMSDDVDLLLPHLCHGHCFLL